MKILKNVCLMLVACLAINLFSSCGEPQASEEANEVAQTPEEANEVAQTPDEAKGASQTPEEEANEFLVGIWTKIHDNSIWEKLVIKSDKTYEIYRAMPIDGKWGSEPTEKGTWKTEKARYSDTGQEYISINLDGLGDYMHYGLALNDDKTLNGSDGLTYEKGDKNPW